MPDTIKKMPVALAVAGSDCSGGAGIQADIKAMTCCGVFAMSAVTALVAENTVGVQGVHEVPPEFLEMQISSCADDIFPDAVKVGMLPSEALVRAAAASIRRYKMRNIVLDPVMAATSGGSLVREGAVSALCESLIPLCDVLTPNIPEAQVLSGMAIASENDMEDCARRIMDKFGCAVLVKGGHRVSDANDFLLSGQGGAWIRGKRIANPNTHGTGCTLSSAIAAGLAKGLALEEAVRQAKDYLCGCLSAMLDLGSGSGPMNHAFMLAEKFCAP